MGTSNTGEVRKHRHFRPISCFVLEMIEDVAIVTVKCQHELVCNLSNGFISNDLV